MHPFAAAASSEDGDDSSSRMASTTHISSGQPKRPLRGALDSIRLPPLTLATFRLYATPRNLFITTLLLIIIVSGAILFMALVGMLSFSDKATKDRWIEITSQILNTCFTINAILLFPSRTVDLWLTMGVLGWVRVGSTSPGTKEEPEDNGPASLPLVNEGRVIAGGDNSDYQKLESRERAARRLEQRQKPWCRILEPRKVVAPTESDSENGSKEDQRSDRSSTFGKGLTVASREDPHTVVVMTAPNTTISSSSLSRPTTASTLRGTSTVTTSSLDNFPVESLDEFNAEASCEKLLTSPVAVLPGRASPPSSSSSLWKKFPQSDLHTTPSDSTLTSNTTRPSSATQSALPPGSPAQIPHPVPARIWISIILLQNLTIWFQIPMSISMWVWATDYTNRPAWLVSCSLVASFLCGAAGGVWPFILTWKEKKQDVNHDAIDLDGRVAGT